ncbi:hypothetical protein [Marinobacter sp. JSM 1782161]|uniref:hypothetical protein n=1 Tax=Marinobacter sp. JSM 1782161 TaxID=2685906 RepID=UPI0014020D5A|nr:hypothetical protein [Marinobacter sp. JSM 1782161]
MRFSARNRSMARSSVTTLLLAAAVPAHAGFWEDVESQSGLDHAMIQTPMNNTTAVSAHNAYTEAHLAASLNLSGTLTKLSDAIDAGADLLELDLVYDGNDQMVKVSHNPGTLHSNKAVLDDVLSDAKLQGASQPLFLELKETSLMPDYVVGIIESLRNRGYLTEGRPVFLRSFASGRANLVYAQQYLANNYPNLAPYVHYSELYSSTSDLSGLQSQVASARADGFDMVEFNYQTPNLGAHIQYAKSLDLGVGLWTIPSSMGEVGLTLFRDEVDEMTTDYDLASARQVVADSNQLLYFNTADQDSGASSLSYYRTGAIAYSVSADGATAPSLSEAGTGSPFFGTVALFDNSEGDHLSFYDADQGSGNGYLVNALVQFNDLSVPDGATWAIVNKSDSAGFALELYNPSGIPGPVLRYGVHVDGAYRYVTYDASALGEGNSYYVTGAYDGNGGVRLYINSAQISAGNSFNTEVTRNNSPVVLAADPQGASDTRFHSNINVQMLSIQDWANH